MRHILVLLVATEIWANDPKKFKIGAATSDYRNEGERSNYRVLSQWDKFIQAEKFGFAQQTNGQLDASPEVATN